MPIESGRYVITHAQYWNLAFLSDANDGSSLLGCLEQDLPGQEWNVKELQNGRYSIVNFGHKMSASAEFHSKKGDHVVGRETDWLWLITEHDLGGKYTISTANGKLRWFLEDDWPKTPITLHDAPPSDPRCHWTFQKIGRMSTAHYEAAVVNAELARKAREIEVAREEVARAKLEVVRISAELEATRRELTAVKAVAAEDMTIMKDTEGVASSEAAEVEKVKREAAHAKEEVERHKLAFRSYFDTISQLDTSRYTITNVLHKKQPRPIQAWLFWAAELGYDAGLRSILAQRGVDINSKNEGGLTALSIAAQNGHIEVARLLLAREGVDVDTKSNDGQTPLMWAARNAHDAVVRLLLAQEGVDVNSKKPSGATALYIAAQNGHDAVLRLLLAQNGVDINSKLASGTTPLYIAAQKGHNAVVQLLLAQKGVDVNSKRTNDTTALYVAAQNGHDTVVQLLLAQEGVDVNPKDTDGWTPLWVAAQYGHDAVVRLLLAQKGVDVNVRSNDGQTPLMCAENNRHNTVAQLLREKIRSMGNATQSELV